MSQLICSADELTAFYMMATLGFNELIMLFTMETVQRYAENYDN